MLSRKHSEQAVLYSNGHLQPYSQSVLRSYIQGLHRRLLRVGLNEFNYVPHDSYLFLCSKQSSSDCHKALFFVEIDDLKQKSKYKLKLLTNEIK